LNDTKARLMQAVVHIVRQSGMTGASARAIAAQAGVNQALIFYHFGTVSELIEAACRQAVDESATYYRDKFAAVTSMNGLLAVGRELHERERAAGNVALMAQLMSGAQQDPVLARAAGYAMSRWNSEIELVAGRVLADSPLAEFIDVAGLARAISAGFIGLELYEGVDPDGAALAFQSLESVGELIEVMDSLGPVARRAVQGRIRQGRRTMRTASPGAQGTRPGARFPGYSDVRH
jgi:AcrR family transcriptional regulator